MKSDNKNNNSKRNENEKKLSKNEIIALIEFTTAILMLIKEIISR